MKRGQKVAVCQDGKWGLAVLGVVTKTRNENMVLVKFILRGGEECEAWFRSKTSATKYGGPRKSWGGWADTGEWCPWYSVAEIKRLKSAGLTIEDITV